MLLELILGAIIVLAITIWLEWLRKPKLKLQVHNPHDKDFTQLEDKPAKIARFLSLELTNKPIWKSLRFMLRAAALQCHGTITFHRLDDGQDIFGRAMPIRWSSSPQPSATHVTIDNIEFSLYDPKSFSITSRMDIYPGETERLDVAARFDNETDCFGWNNDSFFSDPQWRNQDWQLGEGSYLAKVVIVASAEKCEGIFRLINDVPQNAFRLEKSSEEDKKKINDWL
jgi:hypothetical protein